MSSSLGSQRGLPLPKEKRFSTANTPHTEAQESPLRPPAIAKVPLKSAHQHIAAIQIYLAVITYTSANSVSLLLKHTHP